jgi:hypothetical protein
MINKKKKNALLEFLSRIRRNHALEHATIHVLSSQYPKTPLVGRSDSRGFYLSTDLSKEIIFEGTQTALLRLRSGEKHLALHPNCGTNLLTAGVLSGSAAFFSIQGSHNRRERLERLPLAIMSAIFGLVLAQPLGMRIQKYLTTDPNPGKLKIHSVEKIHTGKNSIYRVRTEE